MPESITIGSWEFAPDTGTLTREGETVRLEARTAALLELLCRQAGTLVSQADIIDQVWEGRTVSPNSVAVVISDIRRALGDDPRQPQYVETLPKRGYRLIADVSLGAEAAPAPGMAAPAGAGGGLARGRWPVLAGLAAVALVISGVFLFPGGKNAAAAEPALIAFAGVDDETGDSRYAALTVSVTELLKFELMREGALKMVPDGEAAIAVGGTLILWDGEPAMSLYAESVVDGRSLWSGMAKGPEGALPRQVREEVSELAEAAPEFEVASEPEDTPDS